MGYLREKRNKVIQEMVNGRWKDVLKNRIIEKDGLRIDLRGIDPETQHDIAFEYYMRMYWSPRDAIKTGIIRGMKFSNYVMFGGLVLLAMGETEISAKALEIGVLLPFVVGTLAGISASIMSHEINKKR